MTRLYFTPGQVSAAILKSGIKLRPEDCSTLKFSDIAEELGDIARRHMKRELQEFASKVLEQSHDSQRKIK